MTNVTPRIAIKQTPQLSSTQRRILDIAAQAEAEGVDSARRLQEIMAEKDSPMRYAECIALIARARRAELVAKVIP